MPLPTDYWPREGDVLIVRATVKYDVDPGEGDVHILVGSNNYTNVRIPLTDVTGLHCRRWAVKDRVRARVGGPRGFAGVDGTVISTHGEWVWVKLDHDEPHDVPTSVHANNLEPIVPPPEPAPEPGTLKLGDNFNVLNNGLSTRPVPGPDDTLVPETA